MSNPVVALLGGLAATRGPVLTWYSASGERVELSGAVLAQWAAKTSHLLLDLGAEPGEGVAVDLGPDWRAPIVWLAAWYDGLLLGGGAAQYAVVREDRLAGAPGVAPEDLVVVPVGALAPRVTALPDGAVDFAATARAFPDQPPPPAPGDSTAGALRPSGPAARTLLGPDATAAELVGIWAGGGSVVWHDGLTADALRRIRSDEGVPLSPP